MTKQTLFFYFILTANLLSGMKEISQKKTPVIRTSFFDVCIKYVSLEYAQGQGLNFKFPSDPKEQRDVAHQLVRSLHRQGLTTHDVFKDHLRKIKGQINDEISKIVGMQEVETFNTLIKINVNNVFLKKTTLNIHNEEKKIIFQHPTLFNDKVKQLINDAFKDVPYTITVRPRSECGLIFFAGVSTEYQEGSGLNTYLELPALLWSGKKSNLLESDFFQAKATLAHEARHAQKRHAMKRAVLSCVLKEICNNNQTLKSTCAQILKLRDKYSENQADLLSFMRNSSTVVTEICFRKRIENQGRMSEKYLQLDELIKIIALHDAEQYVWNTKLNEERRNRIKLLALSSGVYIALLSSCIPLDLQEKIFNRINTIPLLKTQLLKG